jgi:putative membrane protein
MRGLRDTRNEMASEGLIHAQSKFPGSYTLVVALLVLMLGLAAIVSVSFHVGPFE